MRYAFGAIEEFLIGKYLTTIYRYSGSNISRLQLEILLVLFFRIGHKKDFLHKILTTQTTGNIFLPTAGIDFDLSTPVIKIYNRNSIEGVLLSEYLKDVGVIIENKQNESYSFSSGSLKLSEGEYHIIDVVKMIGALWGELFFSRKVLSMNDLIVLATCDTPNNFNQAILADCSNFNKYWNSEKEIKKDSVYYHVINRGWRKVSSFFNNQINNIIDCASEELECQYIRWVWMNFWEKTVVDLEVINKDTLQGIIKGSSLLFALKVYSKIYLFNEKDDCTKNANKKLLNDILNIRNEFSIFFQKWLQFPIIDNVMRDVEFLINKLENQYPVNNQLIYSFIDSIVEAFQKDKTGNIPIDLYFIKKKSKKRKTKKENEINVFIASPSDVHVEREYILQQLERKYRIEGYEDLTQKRLIVNGWEDFPPQLGYPQDIINEEIFKSIDIIIAVFKYNIGSPTINKSGEIRALSGTVEELLISLSERSDAPYGMAYFFNKGPLLSLDSKDYKIAEEQWNNLKKFKNNIRTRILYKEYEDKNHLMGSILVDLKNNIERYFY